MRARGRVGKIKPDVQAVGLRNRERQSSREHFCKYPVRSVIGQDFHYHRHRFPFGADYPCGAELAAGGLFEQQSRGFAEVGLAFGVAALFGESVHAGYSVAVPRRCRRLLVAARGEIRRRAAKSVRRPRRVASVFAVRAARCAAKVCAPPSVICNPRAGRGKS